MKAVIQRVSEASVTVNGEVLSEIGKGLLILIGVSNNDSSEDINWLSKKIVNLRIFNDKNGVMNNSVIKEKGEIIVVSQFTLQANTKKGNRPSYINAAKPDVSIPLYTQFVTQLELDFGKNVGAGKFGAHMKVNLINDGPVTIIIDTEFKR